MKNYIIALIVLFLGLSTVLSAHPAAAVTVGFNKEDNLLSVSFNHKVKDNADHYIKEIVVTLNKKEIIRQQLGLQDNNDGGALLYKINNLKVNDRLDITTICNKVGKKSQSLVIK